MDINNKEALKNHNEVFADVITEEKTKILRGRRYPDEFKQSLVHLHKSHNMSAKVLAKESGIHEVTVKGWVEKFKPVKAMPGKKKALKKAGPPKKASINKKKSTKGKGKGKKKYTLKAKAPIPLKASSAVKYAEEMEAGFQPVNIGTYASLAAVPLEKANAPRTSGYAMTIVLKSGKTATVHVPTMQDIIELTNSL